MTDAHLAVPLLGVVGYSGSGKTTLLEAVIPLLVQHGLRVAAIKHTHHSIEPDRPGKDSYRLREAGARQVLLAARQRLVLTSELRDEPALSLAQLVTQLDLPHLDLILAEGFKDAPHAKLEVHRPATGGSALFRTDPAIIAVATDAPDLDTDTRPRLDLNQPAQVAAFMLRYASSRTSTGTDHDPR